MQLNEMEAYRRGLLPRWIRFFCWLFFLVPPLLILLLLFILAGVSEIEIFHRTEIFGLNASIPFTPYDLFLNCIILFFGITAYGLLWGKRWGLQCGILCGVGSAATVLGTMAYSFGTRVPVELFLQIPFVVALFRVKSHFQLKLIGLQDLLRHSAEHPDYRDSDRFSEPA